jgi:hypothetical protein
MRLVLPATALALTGAALVLVPSALRAADESAHDAVERLMPQLLSDDDTVRADAEKSLFQLGDAGRTELERLTRDTDPRRAVAALRLLQSPKWGRSAKDEGEQRVQRDEGRTLQPGADPTRRMEDFRAQIERQLAEMRRQMEQWDKSLVMPAPGVDVPDITMSPGSSGSIVENDKSTKWSVDQDGRVKVTVKDGKDAPEQTYEAKSLDELKKDHPEVAQRIEGVAGRNRTFVFRGGPNLHLRAFGPHDRVDPFTFETPQAPVLGIEWAPVPDVLRDQVDLPEGGVVVENVVKDSLAEKLGLAKHDVLVEVQGKQVSDSADVRAALDGAKPGEKVTALVVRKGAKKTLETTK